MTPCEELGYKVGDMFEVVEGQCRGFSKGEIITLRRDDGSNCPEFSGNHYDGDGYGFVRLSRVKPLTAKLRPAKQALADAIHASGKGWSDGANWAAQDKEDCMVTFYKGSKPVRRAGNDYYSAAEDSFWTPTKCDFDACELLPNWHQTVLSHVEYFSAYPEKVEQPEQYCESVTRSIPDPDAVTTDTLLTTWQSAQAAAREARAALEAAEQAEREAEEAVKAALGKYGWGESVVESDAPWAVGDKCVVVKSPDDSDWEGKSCELKRIDCNDDRLPYRVFDESGDDYWVHSIRRP